MAVHDSKAMATKDIPRILHARDESSISNSLTYSGDASRSSLIHAEQSFRPSIRNSTRISHSHRIRPTRRGIVSVVSLKQPS